MKLYLLMVLHLSTGLGYGSVIPDAPEAESHPLTQTLAGKVGRFVEQYVEAMEKVDQFHTDSIAIFTAADWQHAFTLEWPPFLEFGIG